MTGTKWKPYERVEFKHVVEVSERIGRMSDDSMLLGNVWNELQSAKGQLKQLKAKIPQRHLSDGAMQSLRDDLAEAKAGEPLVLAWNYVSKALDEIECLRAENAELLAGADADAFTIGNLNAHIVELGKVKPANGITDLLHRPGPGEEPGSGITDLLHRPMPGEKPGGGVGPC